jgi:hypothetical protein
LKLPLAPHPFLFAFYPCLILSDEGRPLLRFQLFTRGRHFRLPFRFCLDLCYQIQSQRQGPKGFGLIRERLQGLKQEQSESHSLGGKVGELKKQGFSEGPKTPRFY